MRLTEKEFWDECWDRVKLPITVNKWRFLEYSMSHYLEIITINMDRRSKIMEVGAGASKWMRYYYEVLGFKNVYGLDYSMIGCSLTSKNLNMIGISDGRIVCGDIFQMPFKTGTFDLIYSNGVVEHFEDPGKIISLMTDLLKPNGLLLIWVPNFNGLLGWVQKMIDLEVYLKHKVLTTDDFILYFQNNHIKKIRISYFGSFSLKNCEWSRFASRSLINNIISEILVKGLNMLVTIPLRITGLSFDSRIMSPSIVAVGMKMKELRSEEL